MNFSSKLVEDAVNEISKLPGIGKKSALRIALHLLRQEEGQSLALSGAIVKLRQNICYCKHCFNIADADVCSICAAKTRNRATICVVEGVTDVMAIENTGQYNGLYHVLGGVISPMEGLGPADLKIPQLVARAKEPGTTEIILALSSTMEADTTAFYITRQLQGTGVSVSAIARGVPVGSELEYTDEITLGRSITARTAYL